VSYPVSPWSRYGPPVLLLLSDDYTEESTLAMPVPSHQSNSFPRVNGEGNVGEQGLSAVCFLES